MNVMAELLLDEKSFTLVIIIIFLSFCSMSQKVLVTNFERTLQHENRSQLQLLSPDVPVWFEPTDISRAFKAFQGPWRSTIAYASPNLNELKVMHDAVFKKDSPALKDDCFERKLEESLRLGIPLLNDALHTLVVTLASEGILLLTVLPVEAPFPVGKTTPNRGKVRAIHYPAAVPEKIVSVSGAGDCFAAAMVSAILRGLDPEVCVTAGQRAALLSLASHHAVPDSMSSDVFSASSLDIKKTIVPMKVL